MVNIAAGFALAVLLSRRYRRILARRELVSLATSLGPAVPVPNVLPLQPATCPVPQQPAAARVAPAGPQPKSPGHLAVGELHERVSGFGAKLTEADEQLRQCAATPDLGTIESVLSLVDNTARNFLESRESAQQRLADLTRNDSAWEGIHNELSVASQMQDAEVNATCQEIARFDYESDLAGGCHKVMAWTHRLLNSNDILRDTLEKALAEVALHESCPPAEEDRSDPLTGCVNRAAIEAHLNTWWAGVADHTRLCVAMIDIDQLAKINEQFGYRAGSGILKAIARLLDANRADNIHVARFTGQRFLVLFSDVETAVATNLVERCRQTIAKTGFTGKGLEIHVTVSCGLTRGGNEDSPSSLLLRVETALCDAKRYGRNRTFLHEGKYPTPVAPPEIPIEPQQIAV